MESYKDKKIMVVGLGVTGVATAKVLLRIGAEVTAVDMANTNELNEVVSVLAGQGIKTSLGAESGDFVDGNDLVVVSPGIPMDSPIIRKAADSGVEVLSEIEVASSLTDTPLIAVTGTNGKTTVTTLIGRMFEEAGIAHAVAGNIGRPLIEVVETEKTAQAFVVEVSSFQLEHKKEFKPHIGVILNISEDHLDRHHTMDEYLALKLRLLENQTKADYAVINLDDKRLKDLTIVNSTVVGYSRNGVVRPGAYVKNGMITVILPESDEEQIIGPVGDIRLPGAHNIENTLAAVLAARLSGAAPENIMRAIRGFNGLSHRLQHIAYINGVSYIDDSKATNPDAALRAIRSFDKPIVLIAGGRNKDMDFGALAAGMAGTVKAVVLIGEAADEMATAIRNRSKEIYIYNALSMDQAVEISNKASDPDDVVLLSPACASFDMFSGYEERGLAFAKAVNQLERKRQAAVSD